MAPSLTTTEDRLRSLGAELLDNYLGILDIRHRLLKDIKDHKINITRIGLKTTHPHYEQLIIKLTAYYEKSSTKLDKKASQNSSAEVSLDSFLEEELRQIENLRKSINQQKKDTLEFCEHCNSPNDLHVGINKTTSMLPVLEEDSWEGFVGIIFDSRANTEGTTLFQKKRALILAIRQEIKIIIEIRDKIDRIVGDSPIGIIINKLNFLESTTANLVTPDVAKRFKERLKVEDLLNKSAEPSQYLSYIEKFKSTVEELDLGSKFTDALKAEILYQIERLEIGCRYELNSSETTNSYVAPQEYGSQKLVERMLKQGRGPPSKVDTSQQTNKQGPRERTSSQISNSSAITLIEQRGARSLVRPILAGSVGFLVAAVGGALFTLCKLDKAPEKIEKLAVCWITLIGVGLASLVASVIWGVVCMKFQNKNPSKHAVFNHANDPLESGKDLNR